MREIRIINKKAVPTYNTWRAMRQRCYNKNACNYKYYGGRGIEVCARWNESYDNFVEDMGYRPDGYSLDRIDPNGPYEKSNCRWLPVEEQPKNRKGVTLIEFNGEVDTISGWAKKLKICRKCVKRNYANGVPLDTRIYNRREQK